MSYQIEKLPNCQRKIQFEIANFNLSDKLLDAAKEKQKSAQLKGFRVGKVPLNLVQKYYGNEIYNRAVLDYINSELHNCFNQENINPISSPNLVDSHVDEEKQLLKFAVLVESLPEVKIGDFSSIRLEKKEVLVTESDIDNHIAKMLDSRAELNLVEDKDAILSNGDFAVISFEGTNHKGEKPKEMSSDEFLVEIGSKQLIAGFEEGLMGMKVGDTRQLSLRFPADYHATDLQDRPVEFKVELLEIKQKKVPELDESILKTLNFETKEAYRENLSKQLHRQFSQNQQELLKNELVKKLIELHPFELPKTLMEEEKKGIIKQFRDNLERQGHSLDAIQKLIELQNPAEIESQATLNLKSSLILSTLAREYNVEVTDQDLNQHMEQLAKTLNLTVDDIRGFYNRDNQRTRVADKIREEKLFSLLFAKINLT